ncbi:hypothetical protein DPI70_25365 [Escherichia coli]|nr:hypothetical protein [Escherichia coli]
MVMNINSPLNNIQTALDARVSARQTDIDKINSESNLIFRFFLKLEYLFKYEKFPPANSNMVNYSDMPTYKNMARAIQNAPLRGDGRIQVRDESWAYDLIYIRDTGMWTVKKKTD